MSTCVSGRPPSWARISSGSCSGRKRMSTSMTQVSGTLFSASPPQIRPRLIEGRSKRAELCRAKGSDSMALNTSTALTTALSPSHGVAPCAERPRTLRRTASTPLACTPTWRLVGSPVIAKSPMKPCPTRASEPRFSSSSDSSSETIPRRTRTASCSRRSCSSEQHHRQRALHVVGAAAVEAVPLDRGLNCSRPPGRRRGGRAGPGSARPRAPPRPWSRAARGSWSARPGCRATRASRRRTPRTAQPLRGGGVEGNQALGQRDFVHRAA